MSDEIVRFKLMLEMALHPERFQGLSEQLQDILHSTQRPSSTEIPLEQPEPNLPQDINEIVANLRDEVQDLKRRIQALETKIT